MKSQASQALRAPREAHRREGGEQHLTNAGVLRRRVFSDLVRQVSALRTFEEDSGLMAIHRDFDDHRIR